MRPAAVSRSNGSPLAAHTMSRRPVQRSAARTRSQGAERSSDMIPAAAKPAAASGSQSGAAKASMASAWLGTSRWITQATTTAAQKSASHRSTLLPGAWRVSDAIIRPFDELAAGAPSPALETAARRVAGSRSSSCSSALRDRRELPGDRGSPIADGRPVAMVTPRRLDHRDDPPLDEAELLLVRLAGKDPMVPRPDEPKELLPSAASAGSTMSRPSGPLENSHTGRVRSASAEPLTRSRAGPIQRPQWTALPTMTASYGATDSTSWASTTSTSMPASRTVSPIEPAISLVLPCFDDTAISSFMVGLLSPTRPARVRARAPGRPCPSATRRCRTSGTGLRARAR